MNDCRLDELARLCGAELIGDPAMVIRGPASLTEAGPDQISFYALSRYRPQFEATQAGAVVVAPGTQPVRAGMALLVSADPSRAFTRIVQHFAGEDLPSRAGIHSSAVVAPGARVAPEAWVGPACVIEEGAEIGAGAQLVAGVHIGRGARVGDGTVLHPGVVLYARCRIGARGIVHAGAVIGADGFGFEPTREGWKKIPQCGIVEIGDDVELGANVCIDRGRFEATRIGNGVKLDNLVHLAHNVVVEDGALIIAQAGISGSTRIGKGAIIAGQAGIAGHVTIGAGARIGAQAGVMGSVPPNEDWAGYPARPKTQSMRALAHVQRLPELVERVRELEQRLEELTRMRTRS
jgi:UDP-3-O-[3-hydroxymyristoyl] glucosamine N-acyltransferase